MRHGKLNPLLILPACPALATSPYSPRRLMLAHGRWSRRMVSVARNRCERLTVLISRPRWYKPRESGVT